AHEVVRGGADLHRLLGDVEIGQLLELVVHAGQLLLDVLGGVRDLLLDPGDVEEDAAVRAAAAGAHLAPDAAGDVVAGQELGRAARVLVALGVAPALLGVVGGRAAVVLGHIIEHEALALAVLEDAALAAHAFGDEDAFHTGRPDHAGGMELDELHVEHGGAGIVGERLAVAGVLPTVAGDLVGAADAAGGQHYGLGEEEVVAAAIAVVAEAAEAAVAGGEQGEQRGLHVHLHALMDAVVLQGADHLEAGAVADVGQAGVAVAAEVALQNLAILGAVEDGAPGFELADAGRGFLGVQLGHAPVVEVLAAAHGVGEVDAPIVAVIHLAHGGGHAALGHDGVGLAEQRFGDDADLHPGGGGFDGSAQPGAAGADHQHVVFVGFVPRH